MRGSIAVGKIFREKVFVDGSEYSSLKALQHAGSIMFPGWLIPPVSNSSHAVFLCELEAVKTEVHGRGNLAPHPATANLIKLKMNPEFKAFPARLTRNMTPDELEQCAAKKSIPTPGKDSASHEGSHQPVSQSVSKSVSQSISQAGRQSVSQSVRQSVSHSESVSQ